MAKLTVDEISDNFKNGQEIFRRGSVEVLLNKIGILVRSMNNYAQWWQCPECDLYSPTGLVCLECGHDPTYDNE